MLGCSRKRRLPALLILPVLALVALAIFGTLPHWWHEDDSGRSCSICQASQLRVVDDSVRVTVDPPFLAGFDRPPLETPRVVDGAPITAIGRSPPV